MSEHEWERVEDDQGRLLERVSVPGGWIYLIERRFSCFVPKQVEKVAFTLCETTPFSVRDVAGDGRQWIATARAPDRTGTAFVTDPSIAGEERAFQAVQKCFFQQFDAMTLDTLRAETARLRTADAKARDLYDRADLKSVDADEKLDRGK